ncbi:DUF6414 family protein [Corynebacterium crudilactis]|uniref:Uncharacterized protein n=1 Tax=Corynebacterium crudilactis TaxID=1652495 RepID=A0A172QT61_9CORY|nr:DUF6414 family protein [Corynebacterium crudilactis]ANE03864.1 hypothetical protein ccrud_06325 [Corynebacterium crudilactis]
MVEKKQKQSSIIKVVYFDQDTASDYLDIAAGGNLEVIKEGIRKRADETQINVEASLIAKLSWLPFLGGSGELRSGAEASLAGESVLSKTLSNTILTDYLNAASESLQINKLRGFRVYPAENSMAFMKMFTPYMIAARTEDADFNIALMDEALEKAKGYYELIGEDDNRKKIVLRFNIRAFRNSYGLSDLSRMNLVFHGIKVGHTTELSLSIESELAQNSSPDLKLASFIEEPHSDSSGVSGDNKLPVYDIILAGVESGA